MIKLIDIKIKKDYYSFNNASYTACGVSGRDLNKCLNDETCKFYIYKISNLVNGKIYIGQSVNPYRRWTGHKNEAKRAPKQIIDMSMRKYGTENFTFEIIASCYGLDNANATEDYLIEFYDSRNKAIGYNVRPGGNSRGKWSQEERDKLSKLLKGRISPLRTEFNDEQLLLINNSDRSNKSIGRELNIGPQVIARVRRENGISREKVPDNKVIFSNEQVSSIISDLRPSREIAATYNTSSSVILRVIRENKKKIADLNISKKRKDMRGVPKSEDTKKNMSKGQMGHKAYNKTEFTEDQLKLILSGTVQATHLAKQFRVNQKVIHRVIAEYGGKSFAAKNRLTEAHISLIIVSPKRSILSLAKEIECSCQVINQIRREHAAQLTLFANQ